MIIPRLVAGITVVMLLPGAGAFAQSAADDAAPRKPSQLFRDDVPLPAKPAQAPARPQPHALRPVPLPARAAHLHPVPDPAAEAQATKLLRDLFAEEYQRIDSSLEAAKALAAEMLRQAHELRNRSDKDDLASRYVLLRESVALAAGARDYGAALSAADALGATFAIDAAAMKLDLLADAVRDPAAVSNAETLLRAHFDLADDAVHQGDFAAAASILSQAEALTRKSKNVALATEWQKRRRELRDLQADFRNLAAAGETLRKDPGDPAANLALGRFYCLVGGKWDEGLPLLLKGTDERLRTLAFRDLEGPTDADGRADLAEDWWSLGEEQQHSKLRTNLRERAAHWYRLAVPELTGLKRVLALKRIDAVGIVGGGRVADSATADRQSARPQPAAGPAQNGSRLLEDLARKFPADLRPVPNAPWSPAKADAWFNANVAPGTRITASATLVHSGGLQRHPSTKKPYATLVFRTADPVEVNGLRHQLDVQATLEDQKAMDTLKLVRGERGQLSGTIRQCRISGWSGTKENQLKYLTFVLLLDDVRFVPSEE